MCCLSGNPTQRFPAVYCTQPCDMEADVGSGLHSIRTVQTEPHTRTAFPWEENYVSTLFAPLYSHGLLLGRPKQARRDRAGSIFGAKGGKKKADFADTSLPAQPSRPTPPPSPQRGAPWEAAALPCRAEAEPPAWIPVARQPARRWPYSCARFVSQVF